MSEELLPNSQESQAPLEHEADFASETAEINELSEEKKTKKSGLISCILGKAVDISMILLVALMPLWFLPITLDILELNKQTLLVVLVLIALLAGVGKSLADKTISLSRSWMHLVVAFFLAGYAVSSYISLDRYISFVGNVGQMQWAFITLAAFVLMYAIIVNRFRDAASTSNLLLWFILGSVLTGLYGLLSIFGMHFGNGTMTAQGFNPVGTVNALGTFLVIPLALSASFLCIGAPTGSMLNSMKKWISLAWKVALYASIAIGLILAILIDFWATWVLLIVAGLLVATCDFFYKKKRFGMQTAIITGAIVLISAAFWILPTPSFLAKYIPSEVAPSAKHSIMIAQQALRDAPLFGSGPGTWIYDYAKYRSVAVNVSQFWTIRFERGVSSVLTMISMFGIVGMTLWLLLVGSGVFGAVRLLLKGKNEDERLVAAAATIAWLVTIVLACVYNYNLAHHFAFWLLLAVIAALMGKRSFEWKQQSSAWVSGVLSVCIIIVGIGAVSGTWLMAQRLVADAKFSTAVAAYNNGGKVDEAIAELQSAITMNPFDDAYQRNLSQAYLAKIDQITKQSPNPTKEQVDQINSMITQSVENAKAAVAANPSNVDNYSNLATTYRAIMSFTSGADEFAIKAYTDALAHEPNNPIFMDEIGKIYVLRSDAYRTALNSKDEKQRQDAQAGVSSELDKASDWFNKAIAAKPDYTASHFNLGLVYERQGKLDEAIGKLEQVLKTTPDDINVAFQLAILYYRNNQKDQAKAMFEQIVRVQPNYANARWFLSMIYEEQKQYDKAIEQVQAVKSTNADNASIDLRLKQLENEKTGTVSTSTAATNSTSTPMIGNVPPSPQTITSPTGQNQIKR
ncbi:MAG: tetratricopeptide repeat protein [Patescibacteria group bacterium]